MTDALALVVLVVTVVLVIVAWLLSRPRLLRSRLRSRFVVTLKSGAAFDGLLYASDARTWVLRNAQALGAGDRDADVPVDGEVVLLVAEIDYAQRL